LIDLRSTFHGLNTSSSGLHIAQRQMDVTGHNLANTNVKGYTRQRYATSAVDPMFYSPRFAPTERGKPGMGVMTLSLDQIRDRFLDVQFRDQQTKTSYWDTRNKAMYYIEDVFNTIDANSLDGVVKSFFNSIQELSKNPFDEAIRTNMTGEAKKLVEVFHMYHTQLADLMTQQNFELEQQVIHTNDILKQIAALNESIFRFELGGSSANDLRDERNLLLDELSTMMDITYVEVPFDPPAYNIFGLELAQLEIYAGGYTGDQYSDNLLVSHKRYCPLKLEEESGINDIADQEDPPLDFWKVYLTRLDEAREHWETWTMDELTASKELNPEEVEGYTGGIFQSYLNLRDGDNEDNVGIPYFIKELNKLVETLVTAFNDIHSGGYTMPYSNETGSSSSVVGVDFFNADGLTARTIALSDAILESVFNIAASSEEVILDADGHWQTGNNENALALIHGVIQYNDFDNIGGSIEGFYKSFLGKLASETSQSRGMVESHNVLLQSLQFQRESVSGVNEDEEMTDLVRFQHAYNASARCITTIDEMLDKLINGTGRVGL